VKLWFCDAVVAIVRGVIGLSDGKVDNHRNAECGPFCDFETSVSSIQKVIECRDDSHRGVVNHVEAMRLKIKDEVVVRGLRKWR